jgi:hypothetical protein
VGWENASDKCMAEKAFKSTPEALKHPCKRVPDITIRVKINLTQKKSNV